MLIKSFSKSISLRNTKTDKVDAFTISKFAKYYYQSLKLTKLEDINSIKTLAREKETIEDSIVKLKNQMNSLMTQLFPELIRKVNIFTDTMLNILLKMPSTSSILNASNKDIDNIIDSSVGNKIKISSKELKRLANCSIGISDENLSLVLQSKIRRLFFLKDELLSLDALINKNINNNDKLNSSIEILKSIDGIGDKTSKDFMIEVGDINRFDNSKKLTAYIGTDPSIKQSGTSLYIQGKISKKGNSHLRRTIYKMAIGVCFHNISFKRYYQKKRKEGKSYKQSLIAVANKLIRLIYSMLINRTMYNKNKYYFYPVLT
jgi:transposase